jgi:hypothetical protein
MYLSYIDFGCTRYQIYQARLAGNDLKEGWYAIGQSLEGSKILVVKETYWGKGSLNSVNSSNVKEISRTQHWPVSIVSTEPHSTLT